MTIASASRMRANTATAMVDALAHAVDGDTGRTAAVLHKMTRRQLEQVALLVITAYGIHATNDKKLLDEIAHVNTLVALFGDDWQRHLPEGTT